MPNVAGTTSGTGMTAGRAGAGAGAGEMASADGGAVSDDGGGAANEGGGAGAPGVIGASDERILTYGAPAFFERRPIEECDADGGCSAGKTCFRLTDDIGVCDTPQPVESTQCVTSPVWEAECGCEGSTCALGQTCRVFEAECSCPSGTNRCVDQACQSPTDCAEGSVCTPSSYIRPSSEEAPATGRCVTPQCRNDADCAALPGARCALVLWAPGFAQGGESRIHAIACVHSGPAPPDACAEGQPFLFEDGRFMCPAPLP